MPEITAEIKISLLTLRWDLSMLKVHVACYELNGKEELP